MEKYSVIVIGSGVAGLSFAIHFAQKRPDLKILILTKAELRASNSSYAQGGIASVFDRQNDSFEAHITDTISSGKGLSDAEMVSHVVRNGPEVIYELERYGIRFERRENKNFDLALEGGHSSPRIVHTGDFTGRTVVDGLIAVLSELQNITCLENRLCLKLLKKTSGKPAGVEVYNLKDNRIESYSTNNVVLGTGGCGQVYQYTTNPSVATGDGVALGIDAGADVANMGFVQFHPTAFFEKDKEQLFLISEAVRGAGALLINRKGERFLFNVDPRGELATRDIVSKAIYEELNGSKDECVYLDMRNIDPVTLSLKFPTICQYLKEAGYDPLQDPIPVIPAAHFQCGGLKVNRNGETTIPGLFAIGECAESGLHGSNRLASNSLLEALVLSRETAGFLANSLNSELDEEGSVMGSRVIVNRKDPFAEEAVKAVKKVMSEHVVIHSGRKSLIHAREVIRNYARKLQEKLQENTVSVEACKALTIVTVAGCIVESGLKMADYD